LCQNRECAADSFRLDYRNRGWWPEVKQLIIEMSLNTSGVRDTARSLHISTDTVLRELKKKEPLLESVNTALLRTLNADEVTVDIERAGEAEMDEMWSYVHTFSKRGTQKSNASISRYGPASSAWCARPSASRSQHRCTTSSLAYSSIGMPLTGRCNRGHLHD